MTDSNAPELLPCPFCGGETWLNHYPGGCYVMCHNAECIGSRMEVVYDADEQAIEAWNTRAERTCRNENGNDKYANFICSECGLHMHKPDFGRSYVDEDGKRWYSTSSEHGLHYCPNCGSRVVK